jgi:hypothetical protein
MADCIFQQKAVHGNKISYSCGNPTSPNHKKKCLDCNLKREHKCKFLRSSKRGHFCSSKGEYIDLAICNTCDGRKHSRVKEFVTTATAVVKEPKFAEQKTIAYRLQICNDCAQKHGGVCKVCGCNLNVKTRFHVAHCPLNKW